MSVEVMTLVWKNYRQGGSEKLCMLALADWCDDNGGHLYPSIAKVAHKICTSEKQARRIIHDLIDQGYLAVVAMENGGNKAGPRHYRLNLKRLSTPPAGGSPPAHVTPPANVSPTPPMDGGPPLPPVSLTPPTGGRQYTNKHQLSVISLSGEGAREENETEISQETNDHESQEDGTPAGNTNPGRQGRQNRAPGKPERDRRASRMDEDFVLPADWRQWALEYRPGLDVDRTFEIFRDHFTGSGALKVNWCATWRNWVRRESQFEGKGHGRNKRGDYDAYAGVDFPDFETANIR